MSPNWIKDGTRWRLRCGDIVATCSPVRVKQWLWRVETDGGYCNLAGGHIARSLTQAKAHCEAALRQIMDDIKEGLGE